MLPFLQPLQKKTDIQSVKLEEDLPSNTCHVLRLTMDEIGSFINWIWVLSELSPGIYLSMHLQYKTNLSLPLSNKLCLVIFVYNHLKAPSPLLGNCL